LKNAFSIQGYDLNQIDFALKIAAKVCPSHSAKAMPVSVVKPIAALDRHFARPSPIEREILRLFVMGFSNTEITRGQNRSAKTISNKKYRRCVNWTLTVTRIYWLIA